MEISDKTGRQSQLAADHSGQELVYRPAVYGPLVIQKGR